MYILDIGDADRYVEGTLRLMRVSKASAHDSVLHEGGLLVVVVTESASLPCSSACFPLSGASVATGAGAGGASLIRSSGGGRLTDAVVVIDAGTGARNTERGNCGTITVI